MSETEAQTAEARAEETRPKRGRFWIRTASVAAVLFVLIQLPPYGRNHVNPPATASIEWASAEAEGLVRGACFDCHSNETRWPWYSHLAPASWLIQHDVSEAREKLNFSTGDLEELEEAEEEVEEGEMPPWFYAALHAEARLTEEEKLALVEGLEETFGEMESGG